MMKLLSIVVALVTVSSAILLANTETKTMQLQVQPTHSVILIGETTMDKDGTKNIEMEIIGLNPDQQFEVTFKEYACNAVSQETQASRSAIVMSNKNGSILGFYSGKDGIGLSAIGIKPLNGGQDVCLDVNV
jgi:hypothetical protein